MQSEISLGVAIDLEIEGVWKWSADNRISFHPIEQWTPGTEYKINMDPE